MPTRIRVMARRSCCGVVCLLEDMEFFQFHPTASQARHSHHRRCAGEGGILINGAGERFMPKYAERERPGLARRRLARDLYRDPRGARRERQELRLPGCATRGVNKYAAMDGRTNPDGSPWITGEQVLQKLPDIIDFCRLPGCGPDRLLMPIQPTAHYTMGGIPTNKYGEVVVDGNNTVSRAIRGG